MKSTLDTVVLFRWDTDSQEILNHQARIRCMSASALIRRLLDGWIAGVKSRQKAITK